MAAYNMGYGGLVVRRAALQHERLLGALAHRGRRSRGRRRSTCRRSSRPRSSRTTSRPSASTDLALEPRRSRRTRSTCRRGRRSRRRAGGRVHDRRSVEQLNPELRASRTPPAGERGRARTRCKVPRRQGRAGDAGARRRRGASSRRSSAYVVRFGETLEQVAPRTGRRREARRDQRHRAGRGRPRRHGAARAEGGGSREQRGASDRTRPRADGTEARSSSSRRTSSSTPTGSRVFYRVHDRRHAARDRRRAPRATSTSSTAGTTSTRRRASRTA